MRLLAYGGNSYNLRCRIGEWPPIPEDALGDRSPLSGETLSFGSGLLDDQKPFLIVRQKQNVHERGGYAFSLLLDPGHDVWTRFKWNAAYLATSLFSESNSAGRKLLLRPEEITKNELGVILKQLCPISINSRHQYKRDFLDLLVGTILLPDPIAVSPETIGFAGHPASEHVAALLLSLPPCFRGGFGWFVGGSTENGKAFGARLTLYEGATEDRDSIQKYIEIGKKFILAWETVAADSEFKEIVEKRSDVPVWDWKATLGDTPTELFKPIILLAQYLNPLKPIDELIESLETSLKEAGPMAGQIRRAARRLALKVSGQLTPSQTELLLGDCLDRGAPINPSYVELFDKQTVVREFVKRRQKPSATITSLRLSADLRFEIWGELIRTENDYNQIPAVLQAAVTEFDSGINRENISKDQIQKLAVIALECTVTRSNSLSAWIPFRNDRHIEPMIRGWLQDEANRRAANGNERWCKDYLVFGQDSGGARLVQLNLVTEDVQKMIGFLLREARCGDEFRQDSKQWLADLAKSPLRKNVPLQDKIDISNTVKGRWQNLQKVWQLYHGQKETVGESAGLQIGERESLLKELREMVQMYPAKDFLPALPGLVRFFDGLPETNIHDLSQLQPGLSDRAAETWIEGWRDLDQDIFQREVVRFFLESSEALSETLTLNQFDVEKLSALIHRLLFGGEERDDSRYRSKFEELLIRQGENRQLKDAVAISLEAYIYDKEKRDTFYRRFAWQVPALNCLVECLPLELQDQVVRFLAEYDKKRLQEETYELYKLALTPQFHRTCYNLAMIRFLLSKEGETVKNHVGRLYHGLLHAGTIDAHLWRVLEKEESEKSPIIEREDVESTLNSSSQGGWLERAMAFLKSHLPKRSRNMSDTSNIAATEFKSKATPVIIKRKEASRSWPPSIKPPEDDT